MTADSTIDYEALAQNAMRGVVRAVLVRAAETGLPGEHHFFISFDTQAPGVVLSKRLREKFPEEMTIVLQHRFWDLAVSETQFEVKLTFDGIPERLVVPFAAINVFFDPSVRYALQFEDIDFTAEDAVASGRSDLNDKRDGTVPTAPRSVPTRVAPEHMPPTLAPAPAAAPLKQSPAAQLRDATEDGEAIRRGRGAKVRDGDTAETQAGNEAGDRGDAADTDGRTAGGAVVVNLDAFRKR